ncbi:MAG: hypothetical protein OXC62_03980 [Aestuariivita sp.]|nr:hypothetical protein [Aestuariivita sp.]
MRRTEIFPGTVVKARTGTQGDGSDPALPRPVRRGIVGRAGHSPDPDPKDAAPYLVSVKKP